MKAPADASRADGSAAAVGAGGADSEFVSESDLSVGTREQKKGRTRSLVIGTSLCVGVLLLASAVVAVGYGRTTGEASLAIESDPPSLEVRIDGRVEGRTPLVLPLTPGTYAVAIGHGAAARERRVTLAGSERASIYHLQVAAEVTPPPPLASDNAVLSVVTDPAGGRVSVDGVDRGVAPVQVSNLAAGSHRVTVRNQGAVFEQTVTLDADAAVTVVVGGGARPVLAGGWLAVEAPLRLQIHEDGRLIGSTDTERLMLPAGDHELAFSDEQTGFRAVRTVRVAPGEMTRIALQVGRAPVSVNAIPWADVWVNNERIGETPIGNYQLPLGRHDLELRHPQLGTRRVTVTVTLNGPNRISVNMRER